MRRIPKNSTDQFVSDANKKSDELDLLDRSKSDRVNLICWSSYKSDVIRGVKVGRVWMLRFAFDLKLGRIKDDLASNVKVLVAEKGSCVVI